MKPFETIFISYRSINSWLNWWFFGFFSEGYPLKVWGILSRSPKNHRGRPKPNPKNDHLMCWILSFVRTSKYDGLPSSWKKPDFPHWILCKENHLLDLNQKKAPDTWVFFSRNGGWYQDCLNIDVAKDQGGYVELELYFPRRNQGGNQNT